MEALVAADTLGAAQEAVRPLDWLRSGEAASRQLVVDTRNLLDPDVLGRAGLTWVGVGRDARSGR